MGPYLSTRVGLQFEKEYPNFLFFIREWTSGCCDPPDLLFNDKTTCTELNQVNRINFVWGDSDENYALYFSDSTYTKLLYHDLVKDTTYSLKFKKREVDQAMRKHGGMYIKTLFSNYEKVDNQFFSDFKNELGEVKRLSILLE